MVLFVYNPIIPMQSCYVTVKMCTQTISPTLPYTNHIPYPSSTYIDVFIVFRRTTNTTESFGKKYNNL